ncbi:single-strand DNA endonuclease ASTE1 [Lepisosteus oculatus]|uniref:single-strand DNA endonuclease ASTE1 n=1 Tax=Lepisosteus oculatus TaxID=7918 RepID=UPI0035F524D7
MGVQGLTSYIEGKREFFTDLKLRNTRIVIDGNGLYFRLYFTSGLDKQRGGDYDSFAELARRFFEALSACSIRPFVVLDGGIDYTDKKFGTLKQRAQSRIRESHALSRGSHGSVLPLLTKEVFKQVLSRLQVPYVQCVAEADWEIACLANQWSCSVLASDSDFCIFDLKDGYCPFADFQWNNVRVCSDTEKYIPALCFSVDKFCSHFGHMNKQLLPLLAVIMGNDYVHLQDMEVFFSQAKLPVGTLPGSGKTQARIDGLLRWLSKFDGPEEAVEKVVEYLGHKGHRGSFRELVSSSMKEYELSTSNLAKFFTDGVPVSNVPEVIACLPDWILMALGRGKLSSLIIDVLVLERVLLHVQVENCALPSSNLCSLPIRQVLYGLLLNWKRHLSGETARGWNKVCKDKSSTLSVEEFDRQDLNLRSTSVQAVLPRSPEQLLLHKLAEVPLAVRLQTLLETLGVKPSVLQAVPPHLSLPVSVTCYWLTHSKPRPEQQHLQALLLGLVYGELCRLGSAASCPGVRELREKLRRLRVWRGDRQGMDMDAAHVFSQWQAALLTSHYLNQLLCCPVPEPDCSGVYSGTLVHRVVRELRGGQAPERLLAGSALALTTFRTLLRAVLASVPPDFFFRKSKRRAKRPPRPRAAQTKGEAGRGGPPAARDAANRFSLLTVEDDEDDEDDED